MFFRSLTQKYSRILKLNSSLIELREKMIIYLFIYLLLTKLDCFSLSKTASQGKKKKRIWLNAYKEHSS